ncbi:MAG: HlyD family efflux transporter periplasmic adaptor subunit [Kofleriaceae bacterium]
MKLALALGVLAACGQQPDARRTDPTEPVGIADVIAAAAPVDYDGVITSRKTVVITAPFAGRVLALHVTPGQLVKAGDKIATLDDSELRANLTGALAEEKAAQSEAAAAGAEAGALRAQLGAQERLARAGYAPPISVVSARAALASKVAQAMASLSRGDVAKAKRTILEGQLAKTEIVAPHGGVVLMIRAKEGEAVTQGLPLARVFEPTDLLVRFAVPMKTGLRVGQAVEFRTDDRDEPVVATVERVARQEAPINFIIVEASIDGHRPDLTVASIGHVRITDRRGVTR